MKQDKTLLNLHLKKPLGTFSVIFSVQMLDAVVANYYPFQKQSFGKKGVLENFSKFTGKHLCVRVSF